jgi:26S proteasome regulatory subunit N11
MTINYRKNELEEQMLLNMNKQSWTGSLSLQNFSTHTCNNEQKLTTLLSLAEAYKKSVAEELILTPEQLKHRHVGKQDPKRHLKDKTDDLIAANIVQSLGTMINTLSF